MGRRLAGLLLASALAFVGIRTLVGRAPEALPGGPLLLAAASGGTQDWASCAAAKCLTVYVAPWCGVCRASTAFINAVVEFLNKNGVPARVVVGKDSPEAVAAYAADFGPGTLLDPEGRVPLAGGVPQFIVTSEGGRVLKRQPGVPGIVSPPIPEDEVRRLASYLGLL
ncbi:MAG: hypothetical protein HYV15_06815 [Elusimicrobia bacterium]|nr:hypothetical protein [Elusimicrobiota bacterium]